MSESERKELWHQLDDETGPAFSAFLTYANIHTRERTVREAWRQFSDNPDAVDAPTHFRDWSTQYAWQERARARDHHLQLVRERAMEEGIEEEARRQGSETEKLENRFNELMTMAYTRAMEWLEDSEWTKGNLRSGDVVKIVELHLKAKEAQSATTDNEERDEWDEEKLDEDPRIAGIVERVEAAAEDDLAWGDKPEREEEVPPTD